MVVMLYSLFATILLNAVPIICQGLMGQIKAKHPLLIHSMPDLMSRESMATKLWNKTLQFTVGSVSKRP